MSQHLDVWLIDVLNFNSLDAILSRMNEEGKQPVLPFIDANGIANIAHGTAPSGDDWVIDYEAPRDPDSGVAHCCGCYEHDPINCDCGAVWTPTFPLVGMIHNVTSP